MTTNMNHVRPLGAVPVTPFPRSADNLTFAYMASYRVDHMDTMRTWVDRALVGLPNEKHELAHGIAYQAAKAEIGRALRTPESRLLSEATRDWLNAREVLRCQGAEAGR